MEPVKEKSISFVLSLYIVLAVGMGVLVYWYTRSEGEVAPVSVATTSPGVVTDQATLPTASTTPAPPEFGEEIEQVFVALDFKPWKWVSVRNADGTTFSSTQAEKFSLTFNASGAFQAETDCNQLTGSYEARSGALSLGSIAATKMFCDVSDEALFTDLLYRVESYQFVEGRYLVLKTAEGEEILFQ